MNVSESPTNSNKALDRYWRRNVVLMSLLLLVWAAAGLGAGVLFAEELNAFRLGGFPLGFWFAQQGSILVFIVLILVYCVGVNGLDRRFTEGEGTRAGAPRP